MMQGKLTSKERVDGANGPYFRLQLDGNKQNVFKGAFFAAAEGANVGDLIEFDLEPSKKDPKYKNISAFRVVQKGSGGTSAAPAAGGTQQGYEDRARGQHVGMRAKLAGDILIGGRAPTASDAVRLASELVALTKADIIAEEAQEAAEDANQPS